MARLAVALILATIGVSLSEEYQRWATQISHRPQTNRWNGYSETQYNAPQNQGNISQFHIKTPHDFRNERTPGRTMHRRKGVAHVHEHPPPLEAPLRKPVRSMRSHQVMHTPRRASPYRQTGPIPMGFPRPNGLPAAGGLPRWSPRPENHYRLYPSPLHRNHLNDFQYPTYKTGQDDYTTKRPIQAGTLLGAAPAKPSASKPIASTLRPPKSPIAATPTQVQGGNQPCGISDVKRMFLGKVAKRGRFPWQVGLYFKFPNRAEEIVRCGGALIHPRFVLTAAHCLKRTGAAKMTRVLLGTVDLRARDNASLEMVPDLTLCHDGFTLKGRKGERNPADVCLLRLPRPAPYTSFIRPICLPRALQAGDLAANAASQTWLAAGWGEAGNSTDDMIPMSPTLLFAPLRAVPTAGCSRLLNVPVSEEQVCAGGPEDTCGGDSGAPLMRLQSGASQQAFEVIGVLSFGSTWCGTGKPGVFTRVDSYLPWIQEILRTRA